MGVPMPGLTPQRFNRAVIEVLSEAREDAGLSKRALSERLERGYNYIQEIEAGTSIAPTYELARIADALGMTFAEFAARVQKRL